MFRLVHKAINLCLKVMIGLWKLFSIFSLICIAIILVKSWRNDRRRDRLKDEIVQEFIREQHHLDNYLHIIKSEVVCTLAYPNDELVDLFDYTAHIYYRNIKSGDQYLIEERFIERNWV